MYRYFRQKPKLDSPKWTDYANVACTIGLIVVAFLQLQVFNKQAEIFQGQLKEMHDAGTPAQQSADAASKFAESAKKIERGITNSSVALEHSVNVATANLLAAKDRTRADQRAWLGIIGFSVSKDKATGLPQGQVELRNTGRTPANNLTILIELITMKPAVKDAYQEPDKSNIHKVIQTKVPASGVVPAPSVPPQGTTLINLTPPNLDAAQRAEILSGKSSLIQYGQVTYEDIFRRKHYGQFCLIVRVNGDGYDQGFCPFANDIN